MQVIILDVRVPSVPVARLCNHRAAINGITWAPHSSCHICSAGVCILSSVLVLPDFTFVFMAGDDQQALIWDIQPMPQPIEVPILAYGADGEINQVQWSSSQPDWICICYRDNVEILRV